MFLIIIALISLTLVLLAMLFPALSAVGLIALPCTVLAIVFLLAGRTRSGESGKPQKRAVVDGSNVMHWQDGEPSFEPLRDVVRELETQGFAPGVIFDANAGYLLVGKYQDDDKLAKRLKLPEEAVVVVAKGSPADPIILEAARDMKAIVVTNDRYRDWAGEFPEIRESGFLVRGGYKSGKLWLDNRIKATPKPSAQS